MSVATGNRLTTHLPQVFNSLAHRYSRSPALVLDLTSDYLPGKLAPKSPKVCVQFPKRQCPCACAFHSIQVTVIFHTVCTQGSDSIYTITSSKIATRSLYRWHNMLYSSYGASSPEPFQKLGQSLKVSRRVDNS